MPLNLLVKFLGFLLLLVLALLGCGVTTQDLKQEIQDERRGTLERGEKSFEKREYLGLTSKDSEKWDSTDWSLWMDIQGR